MDLVLLYLLAVVYVLHIDTYMYIVCLHLFCAGLRDSNIGSIKELFKLAFNGRPKLFHYVSSLVSLVCTNPSEPRNEDTPWAPMERCVHLWSGCDVRICVQHGCAYICMFECVCVCGVCMCMCIGSYPYVGSYMRTDIRMCSKDFNIRLLGSDMLLYMLLDPGSSSVPAIWLV